MELSRQLYPTGRAWKMPKNGWLETLHRALALSENKAYNDMLSFQDTILPDNDNFSVDDASAWEKRLGMIISSASLADRKLAIIRKMNHPGTIKARQHYLYVEGQLRAAGFNVFVFENKFPAFPSGYETKTPIQLAGLGGVDQNQHDDFQHGDAQHGGVWGNLVVNNIRLQDDLPFDVGNNLRSTFFIGGMNAGDYAYVPKVREAEFRQLILKLKPAQTVAYLFIIYT